MNPTIYSELLKLRMFLHLYARSVNWARNVKSRATHTKWVMIIIMISTNTVHGYVYDIDSEDQNEC